MSQEIKIAGKKYPCRLTMGAIMEFNRITGKAIEDLSNSNVMDMVIMVYCCVTSACRVDGKNFPYVDALDMADHLIPDDLESFDPTVFLVKKDDDSGADSDKKKQA